MSASSNVPIAERPADAVEAIGSRADDRHMGIPESDGHDVIVGVQLEASGRVGQRWANGTSVGPGRRATKCRILDNENPGLGCWVGDVFFARFGDVDRSPGR
jgi:hypothetical protein